MTANIIVNVQCCDDVLLPGAIVEKIKRVSPAQVLAWNVDAPLQDKDFIISSNDADVSIAQMNGINFPIVIDASELSASDLLGGLNGTLNEESLTIEFSTVASALLDALGQDKTIVLKGTFSEELSDLLAPILLQRKQAIESKGRLIIAGKNVDAAFSSLPKCYQHFVTKEEKRSLLKAPEALIESLDDLIATESLTQLKARLSLMQCLTQSADTVSPWQGLKAVDTIHYDTQPLNLLLAPQESTAFITQRRKQP